MFAEPITPRGIAAFARIRSSRLLLVQTLLALLATGALIWFLDENCFSAIQTGIANLPDTGRISYGKLDWPEGSPRMIVERRLLAIDVDLDHSGRIHSTADIQVEFGRTSIRLFSFLGYSDVVYARDWPMPFNRTDLEPLWGAWMAEILALSALAALLGLLLSWIVLATLYFGPAWLLGFFLNRDLNLRSAWKLSLAALMPGALLMIIGILLYNAGFLNLIPLSLIFLWHFALGWIYVIAGVFFVPPMAAGPKGNPFGEPGK